MKPKDIFGLAVRLLGLLFLYYGLVKGVTPLLDLEIIKHPDTDDILNYLMPAVFNLAIAWWLIGGGLVRRAYPESKVSQFKASEPEPKRSPEEPLTPSRPAQASAPQMTGMEQAEQKLAALVEKPGRPA